MKLSIKRLAHRDIVREVSQQLEAEKGHNIQIDMQFGMLHDRSVGWIVDAIGEIDEQELILKVGLIMCHLTILMNDISGRLLSYVKLGTSIVHKQALPPLKHLQPYETLQR